MISNVAELLEALKNEEVKKLNKYNLKHPPTIGKMYEGLATSLLEKTIPTELNLKFVHGIIFNNQGIMSGEIDCMLVEGEGERIPYTDSFKWHIDKVIVVFEIKKTLYKNQLQDSFEHLRDVLKNYNSNIQSTNNTNKTFNVSRVFRIFSEITGYKISSYQDINNLSIEKKFIYHNLIMEQVSPVRIVLGFNGYKSEYSLRKTLVDFLNDNLNVKGFGIGSFPQLIISGDFSLVKSNGQPYSIPMTNDYWNFYVSARCNPLYIILEFIWTRLSLKDCWGEDLVNENFAPFLSGKIRKLEKNYGWEYKYNDINQRELESYAITKEWEPFYATSLQFSIFNRLCIEGNIRLDEPDLLSFLKENNQSPNEFFNTLLKSGLVAIEDNFITLITEQCQCVILPNGKFAVAENNTNRLTNWIIKQK